MPEKSVAHELEALAKKHDLRIGSLNDVATTVQGFSVGNVSLDSVTGVGGMPWGRLIEAFGPPSSGKTTFGLQSVAAVQRLGKKCAYFDYEHAMDKNYALALGVNIDDLVFTQPDTLEQGFEVAEILQREFSLIIWDSVAGMIPAAEYEGKAGIAAQARGMGKYLPVLVNQSARSGCTHIFINHVGDVLDITPMGQKMTSMGIKRKTTPGGRALKFYASLRLEFNQTGTEKSDVYDPLLNESVKRAVSTNTKCAVVKNKVGPPFGVCSLRVDYGKGFSQAYSVYTILVAHGLIKKEGAIHALTDEEVRRHVLGMFYTGTKNTREFGEVPYIRGEAQVVAAIEGSLHVNAGRLVERAAELASPTDLASMTLDADRSVPVADSEQDEEPERTLGPLTSLEELSVSEP